MGKKKFTEAEIAVLAANPYTFSVNSNQITHTREFKQLYWADYQNRMLPGEIFRKYGYDPAIIGRNRISGFGQCLKKDVEKGLDFCEGRRSSGIEKASVDTNNPSSSAIRDLLNRLDYLEQEVAYLKKISSLRISKK